MNLLRRGIFLCLPILVFSYNYVSLSSKLDLGFEFNQTSVRFSFNCSAGWCGIGFGSDMYNTDMIVLLASQSSNTLTVMDLYSLSEDTPPGDESLGGKNDVHLESFNFTNYGFMAIVSRLLNTGDKYDAIIVPNSTIDMVCATESKKSWIQHDIETHITVSLNPDAPISTEVTSIDDDRHTHGLIMTVMWTCAVPIGIIFSRYFKWWGPWYLFIHILLMASTIGLTMWSASKRYQDEEPTLPMDDQDNQVHMVIGLIILSLVVGEGVLGIAALFSKIFSKRIFSISYTKKLHQLIGWGLLISALVNNKFGWELYDDSQNKIYLGFMFAVIGLILLFEFRHQISPYWKFLSFYFKRNKQLSHIEALEKINKEDREYVFLEEKLLDITWFKYDHPGGYNMLKNAIGEDVGKYMIGCSSQKNFNPYTHTLQAFEMAGHLSIATIPYPKNFLISTNKSNQNLMTWKIIEKNQINENHFIITLVSNDFELNEIWEKAEWLGKHFKVMMPLSFSNILDKRKNISRYYSCFFVNLDKWRQEILAEGYEVNEPINKEQKGLKFIFKVYPLGTVSNYMNNLHIDDTLLLKGPLGPGLGIDNLSGSFLAVAGGTGLIPFLDLVYYLWANRENPHEFKLILYVSFGSRKDAFAIDLLRATEQVIDENIFKLILIFTSEKGNNNIPEIMVKLGKNNPKRAWICGPSGFNRFVEEKLLESGLERKRIVIM